MTKITLLHDQNGYIHPMPIFAYTVNGFPQASSHQRRVEDAARNILRNVPERLRPEPETITGFRVGESLLIIDGQTERVIARLG